MPKIHTFTKRGNKHPWLIYEDELGKGEIIAILKVPIEEFWLNLGKCFNVKFVEKKEEV